MPPHVPELSILDSAFITDLTELQDKIGYGFVNAQLAREALLGERVEVQIGDRRVHQGNQKMAMLGDSLLKTAYLDGQVWVEETCGETNEKFNWLGSNEHLEQCGRQCDIDKMIIDAYDNKGNADRVDVASAVEAIIAAVWLDSNKNLDIVKGVIRKMLGDDVC